MEPGGTDDRPPAPVLEQRVGPTAPQEEKTFQAGREQGEESVHTDARRIDEKGCHVESRTTPNHKSYKSKIMSQAPQYRGITPHAGIGSPAVEAFPIIDPDQSAAGRADDRSGSLAFNQSCSRCSSIPKGEIPTLQAEALVAWWRRRHRSGSSPLQDLAFSQPSANPVV